MAEETKTAQQDAAEKAKALAAQKTAEGAGNKDPKPDPKPDAKLEDEFEEVQVTVKRVKPKDYGAVQRRGQVPYLVTAGKHSTRNKDGEKILVPVGGIIYKDPTSVSAMDDCLERLETGKA